MADRFRLDGLAYHLIWSGSGPKTSGCRGGYPVNASYYIQRALNGRATIRLAVPPFTDHLAEMRENASGLLQSPEPRAMFSEINPHTKSVLPVQLAKMSILLGYQGWGLLDSHSEIPNTDRLLETEEIFLIRAA